MFIRNLRKSFVFKISHSYKKNKLKKILFNPNIDTDIAVFVNFTCTVVRHTLWQRVQCDSCVCNISFCPLMVVVRLRFLLVLSALIQR